MIMYDDYSYIGHHIFPWKCSPIYSMNGAYPKSNIFFFFVAWHANVYLSFGILLVPTLKILISSSCL